MRIPACVFVALHAFLSQVYYHPAAGQAGQGGAGTVIPCAAQAPRTYGYAPALTWDPTAKRTLAALPPKSADYAVWLNGLRQSAGVDYQVVAGGVLFITYYGDLTQEPGTVVVVDFTPGA